VSFGLVGVSSPVITRPLCPALCHLTYLACMYRILQGLLVYSDQLHTAALNAWKLLSRKEQGEPGLGVLAHQRMPAALNSWLRRLALSGGASCLAACLAFQTHLHAEPAYGRRFSPLPPLPGL